MARKVTRGVLAATVIAVALTGCGRERADAAYTVQVDVRHDDFAAAFNAYFPKALKVHPGDTVRFENSWSGEPHSVTMGKVVDDLFEFGSLFEKYDSEEAALAGGVSQDVIDRVNEVFGSIPGMTTTAYEVYQPGAKPCYIARQADVPFYGSSGSESITGPSTECPAASRKQPEFTGRQALYNSGLIPFNGADANTFVLPIADDAEPGTYNYFCTYHWIDMAGTISVVPKSEDIPSRTEVIRQARREVDAMAKPYEQQVEAVADGDFGDLEAPVSGLPVPEDSDAYAYVNEFYPATIRTKVGKPVTWSNYGAAHTISFNVPRYFPVFSVGQNGDILLDKRVGEAVGWDVPPPVEGPEEERPPSRRIDVGAWAGGTAFRSSGPLQEGDTFSVTFTQPGTYPYACLLHPAMIGRVEVSA